MTQVYDVAIVGAGAMGSAAAWVLTKAGREVVVLEQFELGHARGGSHGATRIFRVGSEQVHRIGLAERARVLWRQLESETGTQLLTASGSIEHGMGPDQTEAFRRVLSEQGIDHEVLDALAASERWPGMRFEGAVLNQPGGGILHADRVVAGLQQLTARQGATMRSGVRVLGLSVSDPAAPVVMETTAGPVHATHAIVTAGPWAAMLLAGVVALPTITATQEQPRLFAPFDESDPWPAFVHWRDDGGDWGRYEGYGLFEAGAGVKVGLHASGPKVDPDRRDFEPEPLRDEALHAYVRRWLPGLDPTRSTPISCVYDNTDDRDFVIDRVGPITVAVGFNGEGFKFVPAIGELLGDLALGVADPPPLFTLARHAAAAGGMEAS